MNTLYNYQNNNQFKVLGYATNISSSGIISQTNTQRQAAGLAPYSENGLLYQAALDKANDMLEQNYWAHVSPSGVQPWSFIGAAGYDYAVAGENLAKDFSTSENIVNGWMNSVEHRANILNGGYAEIGVAVVNGNLEGRDTTLVVAFYASRKVAPAQPIASTSTAAAETVQAAPKAAAPVIVPQELPSQPPTPVVLPDPTVAESKAADIPEPTDVQLKLSQKSPEYREVEVRQPLNWAESGSLFVISFVALINILKHTLVWRKQKRGWRHIWLRSHPAAQYILIITAIILTLTSGYGTIL